MKLQFLKEDALYQLKANINYNKEKYSSDSNDWIYEYFGADNSPFCELKNSVPEFDMFMDSDHPEGTDVENAKRLYMALKDITPSQATDERLWAGLAHGQFWKYMQYRLKTQTRSLDSESIKHNFFFKHGINRSLIMHPIARLWWISKHVYDETNKDDPFHLMRYFKTGSLSNDLTLFSSHFTHNPKITNAILSSVMYIEDFGIKVNEAQKRSLIRYVNMLGGTFILDYLTKEELEYKIVKYYKSAYVEGDYFRV